MQNTEEKQGDDAEKTMMKRKQEAWGTAAPELGAATTASRAAGA